MAALRSETDTEGDEHAHACRQPWRAQQARASAHICLLTDTAGTHPLAGALLQKTVRVLALEAEPAPVAELGRRDDALSRSVPHRLHVDAQSEAIEGYAVTPLVSSARNDGPELVRPLPS